MIIWYVAIMILFSLASFPRTSLAQTPPSGLRVSVTEIDFTETAVGSQSPAHTITLSNPAQSKIDLTQILTAGIDFSEKHDCAQVLDPRALCTIQVFFKPAIPGPRNGSLVITGSDPASPHFIALTGTGK
ncbi:MAG: hypothetical protein ACRD3P_18710 [Terriglobales bacterium]